MSANVALSDTFDQWRMKTNEWLSMTNLAGSSNSIKLANTTDSSSNTTGSITTAGGLATGASLVVGGDIDVFGDMYAYGTTNLDTVNIGGNLQIDVGADWRAVTVGVDDTGYDVKFFGATSGQYLLWDESADDLILSSDTFLNIEGTRASTSSTTGSFRTAGGVGIAKKLFVGTDLDVNGTTNLDVVDIDGATQIDAAVTVGVDGTGYDVKLFGATASAYLLWDESADDLILAGAAALSIDATTDASSTITGTFHTDGGVGIAKKLFVGTDLDVNGTANLDAVDIDGTTQIDAAVTVGVDGTGADVKFFGATASAYMLWDESADDLILAGAAAISIDATTDASSTTTGSFHTDGGVGIAKKLFVGTDLDVNGATTLDAVDIDGATQIDATLTVGVDSTGFDVNFFGATSGKSWLFDESGNINVIGEGGDDLIVLNSTDGAPGADEGDNIILDAFVASGGYIGFEVSSIQHGGTVIMNSSDGAPGTDAGDQIITEDFVLEIGISGITAVSDLQQTGTITVGEDDTGHNVKFFGATSGKSFLWDESADSLIVTGTTTLTGTANLDAVDIDGATQIDATLSVGINDTGYDVKLFGATSGAYMLWDESADDLIIAGGAAISIDATTDATNTTSGTFHTDGGVGIAKKLYVGTDLDVNGTTNLDVVDIDGVTQIDAAVTVGVDGTGYDVKFFGATSGAYMLWDQANDDLVIAGGAALSIDATTDATNTTSGSFHTDGGVGIAKKLYVGTDLDVNGTTNLDAVDIDGATQIDATLSVGVDNTGYDVKFFGATAGKYWLWDESADKIIAVSDLQQTGTITVGVNDTGHDVKFFGATASAYMLWDESADDLVIAGGAAISIDATTDSSSVTTGSFHTDGGVGIVKKLYVGTDLDVNGTTNLDAVDIDGATQIDATVSVGVDATGYDVKMFGDTTGKYWLWDESADKVIAVSDLQQTGTVTVGVDNTGHNVKFFGATSGAYMLWDESADDLILAGAAAISIDATTDATNTTSGTFHTDGGVGIAKKLFVGTDLDVNGTTNLDVVDIDGATQIDATLSVGVNDTGYDVKFFGATASKYWLWDESADKTIQVSDSQLTGELTVGVDDTGHDVIFYGAAAGALMMWDESVDSLLVRGASADAAGSSGKILLQTGQAAVADGDIIGRIDWNAPAEDSTDGDDVGASIWAEADAAFSATVNSTDLVFATGDSGVATEKLRIDSTGVCTFADGAIDVDIVSHYSAQNGLKLGGTLLTATASELNDIIDRSATVGYGAGMAMIFS